MKFFRYCLCCLIMMFSVSFCAHADEVDGYMRVVLVGDYRCGKTSLWKRLGESDFDESEQRSDYMQCRRTTETVGDRNVQFNIWDTAGANWYYDQVVKFTEGANMIFIVHDISESFSEEKEAYLEKLYRDIHEKIRRDGIIVIVGSKFDRRHEGIVNASKQINLLEGVAKAVPCPCVFTSAKEDADAGIRNLKQYLTRAAQRMELYGADPDKGIQTVMFTSVSRCKLL